MRVLVLCKRQYTGRDLLDDGYGRLYELPVGLAALGHEVHVVTSSYRRRGASVTMSDGVFWRSVDAVPWPAACLREQVNVAVRFRPDVVWASSDALHAIAGARLARRFGVPVVVDMYDDYEAFGLTRLPGLRRALRQVCSGADGLSVVSRSLARTLPLRGALRGQVEVIGNGVPESFAPTITRQEARRSLNLPEQCALVGTAGALDASRGISDLLDAFALLRQRVPGVRLVVAGPRSAAAEQALPADVIDLGQLPHDEVPILLRALNVGVVCNRDSAFGRACHPQKLVEMIACGVPLVAAAVGEAACLLSEQAACLYTPGDGEELASRLAGQLVAPVAVSASLAQSWQDLAARLEGLLARVVQA